MARKDSLKKLKDVLVSRRDALKKALAGDLSALKDLAELTKGDLVDAASDAAQDEISSQLAEVESRELASIDAALERMKAGTFGKCEGCNSNIPLARLEALPSATCCIECQRKLEEYGHDGRSPIDWSVILGDDTNMAGMEMDFS
jgi:DnaK suppressor protein